MTIINYFQSFGRRPSVFVSAKYTRSTKPDDAMYVWLENVNSKSFEVCIREFLQFDGKHQDTIVVGDRILTFYLSVFLVHVCELKLNFGSLKELNGNAIYYTYTFLPQYTPPLQEKTFSLCKTLLYAKETS